MTIRGLMLRVTLRWNPNLDVVPSANMITGRPGMGDDARNQLDLQDVNWAAIQQSLGVTRLEIQ